MKTLHWSFAHKHPAITFLLITFVWTWFFWFAAIPFRNQNNLLVMAMVLIGGFGPAVGGILTLGLKNGLTFEFSAKKTAAMMIGASVIFILMTLRYQAGNIKKYDFLAENLSLNVPIIAAALFASLVGGCVISNAFSGNVGIRTRMASILPWKKPPFWTLLGLFFYPALILVAWGLASLLGLDIEYPGLWKSPILETLPFYVLTFSLTALAQGGNEEPGWRGFLQPELQKRFNPLVAAIFVAVVWSLWHLPLYLNGFYPGNLVEGMIGGGIFRILLAIFLGWFYNRSDGNLFAIIMLHTSFNVMVNFLPTSDIGLLVLWLVVVIIIVIKDKMYRKLPTPQALTAQETEKTASLVAKTNQKVHREKNKPL
jgi:membrane protease YdiL (CAAX protease family)